MKFTSCHINQELPLFSCTLGVNVATFTVRSFRQSKDQRDHITDYNEQPCEDICTREDIF